MAPHSFWQEGQAGRVDRVAQAQDAAPGSLRILVRGNSSVSASIVGNRIRAQRRGWSRSGSGRGPCGVRRRRDCPVGRTGLFDGTRAWRSDRHGEQLRQERCHRHKQAGPSRGQSGGAVHGFHCARAQYRYVQRGRTECGTVNPLQRCRNRHGGVERDKQQQQERDHMPYGGSRCAAAGHERKLTHGWRIANAFCCDCEGNRAVVHHSVHRARCCAGGIGAGVEKGLSETDWPETNGPETNRPAPHEGSGPGL